MRKVYKYGNNFYYFNHDIFNNLFDKKRKKEGLIIKDMERMLADFIHVSESTVHGWRHKFYSPNNIDLIEDIAKYFGYNIDVFLFREGDDNKMEKLSEIELLSVKRVYESIIEFLEYFYKTNGFNDLWFKLKNVSSDQKEDKLWKIAVEEHEKVMLSVLN